MPALVKIIKKAMLWVITAVIPVVVAACYGVMYAFQKTGTVIDKDTRQGIEGIQVSCLVSNRGDVESTAYTYEGQFYLNYDRECNMLLFQDVDGEDNGGYYGEVIIPASEYDENVPVEMEKQDL
jgi:hypothetical protein